MCGGWGIGGGGEIQKLTKEQAGGSMAGECNLVRTVVRGGKLNYLGPRSCPRDQAGRQGPPGAHFHPVTKEKFGKGENIDLYSLLFRKPEPKPWASCARASRELELFRWPKADKNWDTRVSGITIYHAVVMQHNCGRAWLWRSISTPRL